MNSLVRFETGTQAEYDAVTKDKDVLYYTTDTKRVFKGSTEYTKSAKVVSQLPAISNGEFGVLYINTSTMIPCVFTGTQYLPIIKQYSTTIGSDASDDTVPTTLAVKNYVDGKQSGVTDLTYTESTGNLNLYKDGGVSISKMVQLTGMAHAPTYESSTRKITIPIFGEDDLVIELGVDAFVSSGSYNSITKTIDLVLTNGQTVSVPAEDLVNEYTAGNTTSINMSLDQDSKFTAEVNISSEAGNKLVKKEDGLYSEGGDSLLWNTIS